MSLLSLRPGAVGGAETYVRALVRELPAAAAGDELVLVLDRDLDRELPAAGWRKVVVPLGARAVVAQRILEAYTPWRARGLERLFDRLGADVALFPQQSIFPARQRTPAVLTVVDVQHLQQPENFGLFDRTFRPRVYPRSMAAARHLLAISEFTRRTLIETCGVAAEKVTAISLGFAPRDVSRVTPHRAGGPYLYYPAATFPHKAHDTLFRAIAELRRRGAFPYRLLLTGATTSHWRSLRRLMGVLGIGDVVEHLGFVSRAQVDALYAGAEAVVFPSRYEGFGLPVVEAAQFGRPIVTSRLPVFDEIGVPPEWQIDFADPGALAAALGRPGPTRLARAPATWSETARRTLEVLRAVGGGRAP
jgi:glycosyltransferase involved in cell wall biosynthesis